MRRLGSRRRRLLLVTVLLLAAVGVAGWRDGWWSASAPEQRGSQASGVETGTGLTLYPAGGRVAAPDIRGETLDGGQLALADLRGQVVVLNVWGSWCQPCRAETPELVRAARETQARGVRFVGIDTRDNPDAARAFVRAFKVPYPSIIDRDGQVLLAFNGVIPAYAVPSTLVIDPTGRITARMIGRTTYATVRGIIEDVLAETNSTPSKVLHPPAAGTSKGES